MPVIDSRLVSQATFSGASAGSSLDQDRASWSVDMLSAILRFSLQFRFLILAAMATLIVLGSFRLPRAPVEALPELSAPVIEVQTEALGLSAAEVEDLVTLNMEEILTSISWLKSISSKSLTGLSSIILTFEPGTDLMRARQLVQERLNLAHALPNVSKPPVMLQPLSTSNRAMVIGLSPRDVSLIDLSVLARWTITPKLLGVPGVANVSVWGQRARQLQVQVDPQRLSNNGVTLDQIVKAAGDSLWVSPLGYLEASTPSTSGWIDTPNQRLGIQHVQPITSAGELAKVAIQDSSLRLGEVAEVVEGHPPLIGDAIVNDKPGLLLVVEKNPNVSSIDVVKGVRTALEELRRGLPGIDVETSIYEATGYVELGLSNLGMVLLVVCVLLLIVLVAGFWSLRAGFVSLVAIGVAILLAAVVKSLGGSTFNMMVVAGFAAALAVVIQDAIFGVDSIVRHARRHVRDGGNDSVAARIYDACIESRGSGTYVLWVLLLAAAPLFFIDGPLGAFIRPLALSFVLAILASTLVALSVTPAMSMLLFGSRPAGEWGAMRHVQRRYGVALERIAHAPRWPAVAAGAVVVVAIAALPWLSWSVLPSSFKEREVRVAWEATPSTSLAEMRRVMVQASRELRLIPGVRNVGAHLGRAITGDQIVDIDSGQIWVSIAPDANYDATLAAIRDTVEGYAGVAGEVETFLTNRLTSLVNGPASGRSPIVVRVQGPQREVLQSEALKVAQALSGTGGLVNLRVQGQTETPRIEIQVDLAAAGRAGVKPGDVRRAAATVFAGLEVGSLFEQQKVFDVVVWGAPEPRNSLTAVRDLMIDTPEDTQVRLADIADVRVAPAPKVIEREGVSRFIDIRADVAGRDVASVTRDVQARLQNIKFPLEYHAVALGEYQDRQAAYWRVVAVAIAAAAGIYLLLQACFQSWALASVLFLSLSAAVMGGLATMLLAGGTASVGSVAGCLAVLGIAARYAISLIQRYRRLEDEGETFGPELVRRAGSEQLQPILISTAGIGAVFIAILLAGSIAGLEILHPMAVVILGGLVVATLTTLFVTPALLLLFARRQERGQPELRSAT